MNKIMGRFGATGIQRDSGVSKAKQNKGVFNGSSVSVLTPSDSLRESLDASQFTMTNNIEEKRGMRAKDTASIPAKDITVLVGTARTAYENSKASPAMDFSGMSAHAGGDSNAMAIGKSAREAYTSAI